MQLHSTLLFLTTLLAATSALPDKNNSQPKKHNNHPEKYKFGEEVIIHGLSANIRGWITRDSCSGEESYFQPDVPQTNCYVLPETEFLSYKIWQSFSTPAGLKCTFSLYDDQFCNTTYVTRSGLPSTEKKSTCYDGVRSYDPDIKKLGGLIGSLSFQFLCRCADFYGCMISKGH